MEYKGYELRYNVRWLVHGRTHNAAVGVFKGGYMVAPCADMHTAQKFVDQRVAREEREQRERERCESDRQESQRVRRTRPARK